MKPKIFAFYLPQFYPFKENDEWWGKGFTEWTNVAKAKPLFPGHYQPRVPADMSFYDLRLSEPREQQAELAKEYGIDAFCYYHYWFGDGKVLLNKPLEGVVSLNKPDFPFFVCWANHSWYNKNWNSKAQGGEDLLLIEQKYLGLSDVEKQFNYLLPMFKDPRYYKLHGKLVFSIYKADSIPYIKDYCALFNKLAEQNNLPGFYYISNVQELELLDHPSNKMMDANFLCLQKTLYGSYTKLRFLSHLSTFLHFPFQVISYKKASSKMICDKHRDNRIIPVIMPNWDHSPRLGYNGTIFHKSTPTLWGKLVEKALKAISNKPEEDQIIMIKSWNEWAEGNYLEPDMKFGRQYLEKLKIAIDEVK